MRIGYRFALVLLAVCGAPSASAASVTDAAACETIEGFQAFVAQWNIDVMGALSGGTLQPEVATYITGRADALARTMPVKPTPGDMVQYCEYLNALYAR